MKRTMRIARSNWINNIGLHSNALLDYLTTDPLSTLRVVDMVKHPEHVAIYSHGKRYSGMNAIRALVMEK